MGTVTTTDAEKVRRAEALAKLAVAFRTEMTETMWSVYGAGLADLSLTALRIAVTRAIENCRFFPSIAELRQLAGVPSVQQRALLAWGAVQRASRQQGPSRSVKFDDATTNATIRYLGGWPFVCQQIREGNGDWARRNFQSTYALLFHPALPEEERGYLPGMKEERARHDYGYSLRRWTRERTGENGVDRIGSAVELATKPFPLFKPPAPVLVKTGLPPVNLLTVDGPQPKLLSVNGVNDAS